MVCVCVSHDLCVRSSSCVAYVCVCTYVDVYVRMHACVHVCMHVHACMYVCVCMYASIAYMHLDARRCLVTMKFDLVRRRSAMARKHNTQNTHAEVTLITKQTVHPSPRPPQAPYWFRMKLEASSMNMLNSFPSHR